ncbi:MAG: c-type cytochrome [Bryobacteraceae bacterium]|nr:c-type cytochrome [Bryobacteraceae bacterium]
MISWKTLLMVFASGAFAYAAGDAKAGADPYAKACKSCHGADGAPNPAVAKMMKVEMRHLGDPAVQALTDAKWEEAITKGWGKMKPVKGVTANQVADVIAFCRTLKK